MKSLDAGVIRRDEAYSKKAVLEKLGISQSFWDKMLDDGLPYASIGHSRWVTGDALVSYLEQIMQRKNSTSYQTAV
jgi:hypothetical protein